MVPKARSKDSIPLSRAPTAPSQVRYPAGRFDFELKASSHPRAITYAISVAPGSKPDSWILGIPLVNRRPLVVLEQGKGYSCMITSLQGKAFPSWESLARAVIDDALDYDR